MPLNNEHLDYFRSLVEGQAVEGWHLWWARHQAELQDLPRTQYLKLKFPRVDAAAELLTQAGVNFEWSRRGRLAAKFANLVPEVLDEFGFPRPEFTRQTYRKVLEPLEQGNREEAIKAVKREISGILRGKDLDPDQRLHEYEGDAEYLYFEGEAEAAILMLEFLVREMDFNIFAIEASLTEALDVNRYVLSGEGDPARALAGMYFWIWDTEEVLALIRWMREYNRTETRGRKVKFYGFDKQFTARAARTVLDYLHRVDPAAGSRADRVMDPLADPFVSREIGPRWPEERQQELADSLHRVVADFDDSGQGEPDGTCPRTESAVQSGQSGLRVGSAGGVAPGVDHATRSSPGRVGRAADHHGCSGG